eukprot:3018925-Amphidinium_carterae.2
MLTIDDGVDALSMEMVQSCTVLQQQLDSNMKDGRGHIRTIETPIASRRRWSNEMALRREVELLQLQLERERDTQQARHKYEWVQTIQEEQERFKDKTHCNARGLCHWLCEYMSSECWTTRRWS